MNDHNQVNVVLIDDDEADNYIHKKVIHQHKDSQVVAIFESAIDALDWIKTTNTKIDIIFLDINMPMMNGYEFLEEYKNVKNLTSSPTIVIMLTSSHNPKDITQSEVLGVKHQLKPLTLEQYQNMLSNLNR